MKKRSFLHFTFLVLSSLFFSTSQAAIMPLTGSSLVNQPQSSTALSQMGFQIKNIPTGWNYKNPVSADLAVLELRPDITNSKAVLSFRTETVSEKTDLEKYVRQYLRDYNQYGFEVTGLQSVKSNLNSVVVDLNQKNKATRSRQVFYKKDNKIVLVTCLDEFEQFNKTILICNSVLNTFQWR